MGREGIALKYSQIFFSLSSLVPYEIILLISNSGDITNIPFYKNVCNVTISILLREDLCPTVDDKLR